MSPSLLYPHRLTNSTALNAVCPQYMRVELPGLRDTREEKRARPVLGGARVLTLQPAEEIVRLEDRLGS